MLKAAVSVLPVCSSSSNMSNGQGHQRGCFWQLLRCCCGSSDEDEQCPSLLGSGAKGKGLEINQTSEVQHMEYRFVAPSDPASEVPSEYHSETEDMEMDELGQSGGEMGEEERGKGEGERGESEREEGKHTAGQEPIMVDSPSHKGLKWRLVPTTNLKQPPK